MKALLFILILLGAAAGLYFYQARDLENANREKVRQACLDVHYKMPVEAKMVGDVEGLCTCQSEIDLQASAEIIKQQGRACMDQFGKADIVARCEKYNVRLAAQSAGTKKMNCDCFYDQLMNLSLDQMMAGQAIKDLTPEQAQQVSRQAVTACMI